MTTPPLPELFERVAAKVPEIASPHISDAGKAGFLFLNLKKLNAIAQCEIAEALIDAACVRWLLSNSTEHPSMWREVGENCVDRYWVTCSCGWDSVGAHGPTLTHALLLAVEAVGGGGKEVNP